MSRETILNNIRAGQPQTGNTPEIPVFAPWFTDPVSQFVEVARAIGSEVHVVSDHENIMSLIRSSHASAKRMITKIDQLVALSDAGEPALAHDYESVDLYIVQTTLAIAENGAVWLTESELGHRVLPFICQHLAVIVPRQSIVATMHDAYQIIGAAEYGFAAFIAGPSKTADIEQSLVLGAHGPKSMTLFIL